MRRIDVDKIAVLADVERRLVQIERIDEAKSIRDQAEAFRRYAKSARAGLAVQNRAAAIKLQAEHRAGVLLARIERRPGGRGKTDSELERVCEENDIASVTCHRWQTLATLPEVAIRERETACTEAGVELTSTGIYIDLCRQRRANIPTFAPGPLPGIARVVYADPPWPYGDSGVITDTDAYGRAARHYPPMAIDDIAALPVADHVTDDAVLFFWVTSPFLSACWPILDAWGFTYKTSIVWDKVGHNYGHYVSVRHELLLIATRGSCLPDRPLPMPDSVQVIQRADREHSAKPEAFRDLITRLYDGPYLELFGRRPIEGWTVWGNQLGDAGRSDRPAHLSSSLD